jgi:hypothetical protein
MGCIKLDQCLYMELASDKYQIELLVKEIQLCVPSIKFFSIPSTRTLDISHLSQRLTSMIMCFPQSSAFILIVSGESESSCPVGL